MHKLVKYLEDENIKHADFALKLGISKKHLSQILNYKTGVSLPLAGKIKDATKGKVTTDMIFDECLKVNKESA